MLLARRASSRAAMLPRLLSSSGAVPPQEGSSKLLELADRDGDTEQPTPSSQGVGHPDEDEPMPDAAQEAAMASVITQVQSRDQQQGLPPAAAVQYAGGGDDEGGEGGEVRSNWKNKFRCVLAGCGKPQRGGREVPVQLRQPAAPCHACHAVDSACPQPASTDRRATPRPRRSIFCCLAPGQSEQYVRQDEGPVVIRPIAPQPPQWAEPVLGPQLAQDAGKKCLVLDLGARGGRLGLHAYVCGTCACARWALSSRRLRPHTRAPAAAANHAPARPSPRRRRDAGALELQAGAAARLHHPGGD